MSKKRKQYRVQASTTTNTYVYCWNTAREALRRAQQNAGGHFYSCMTAGVFAAFTVEAFLNHLGQLRVREWDALERKLGPREKLLLLQQLLHLSVDHSKRPFQTLRDMLRLRDSVAHGKTETVTTDLVVEDPQDDSARYPEPDWKKLCAISSVARMVEDAEAIVRNLSEQLGWEGYPLDSTGHGSTSVSGVGEE
jgi:hypothetical protein